MSAQDVINALNKQKAEAAGINFDDDQDANPLLKRRTLEEMDVSNFSKAQAVGFAARLGATDTVRGASQITGIGEEETKKEQLMLNQLMKNKEYGGYVTAAYFGGLIADPAGWVIPFAKARSIYKMAKYGLITGGIAGATGYVDEDIDSLIGEGKMTRTEQTMIGVVGGGTIAPLAGGIGNVVNKMRGRPVVPLREKIIPENVKPVEILTKSADDVADAAAKRPTITNDELEGVADLKLTRGADGKIKSAKKLVDGKDFNVKQKESKALGPVRQFFNQMKYGDANFISRAVMQNPTGPLGGVIGGVYGYENWGEYEDDTNIMKKLTGALLGASIGAVAGGGIKKIPLGLRKDSDTVGELFARNFRDRYGLKDQQQYKDALTRFRSDQGNFYGRLGNAQEVAAKLSPEDNKILYRMLTGEIDPVSPKDVSLVKSMEGLTEDQQLLKLKGLRELQKEVRAGITELGQQMVDDGLLDVRTFRENIDTYLHRKYIQYEDIADRFITDDKKRAAFTKGFRDAFSELRTNADELKPRGILREIKAEDWVKDYKNVSSQQHLKTMGKKMGFNDIASARKIDMVIGKEEVHKGWELFGPGVVNLRKIKGKYYKILDDGTKELVKANSKGEQVIKIRWQLSKAQRLALGEIEDASVAIFETGRLMSGDLSINKFYKKIGEEGIASSKSDLIAKSGLTNKQVDRSYTMIPDTEIGETGIKAYGSAAGKYVPNAVAYDLQQFNKYRNFFGGKQDSAIAGFGATKVGKGIAEGFPGLTKGYLGMQQLWKKTKTAYNPAVHTNNIMSNIVLFDLAIKGDVYGVKNMGQYHAKYLKEAFQSIKNKDGFYKLAERQGLFDKDFLRQETSELNQYITKAYDDAFKNGEDLDGIAGRMMNGIAKTKGSVDFISKFPKAAEQIYRKEDHIFRLAIMKQRLDLGLDAKIVDGVVEGGLEMQRAANKALTNFEKTALRNVMNGTITNVDSAELKYVRDILDHATQQGTKWFIDYDIQAPAINLLRASALPFLAYTYRVVPLLAEASLTQPAKFAKWAALGYGLNQIGTTLGKGDTEKERNLMSKDDQQRVFSLPFLPHRMVKVPVNMGGNPTYIDITRWTPGGDVFELRQGEGQWPFLPTPLQPSFGGVGAIAFGMAGYDPYTAQPVAGLGAPGWFDSTTKLQNIAYQFIPNIAVIPGTYAHKKVVRTVREGGTRFQDDLGPLQALLDTLGVKLKPADLKTLEFRKQAELRRQLDSLQETSSQLYLKLQKKESIGFNEKSYYKEIEKIDKERTKLLNEYSDIFSKSFDDKKNDPIKNGVWPNLTKEQIEQMNLDIYKFIEENNMGTISGTTQ